MQDNNKEVMLYINLFQPFAQYRNPFTFYYAQSFPLPPPSTIYGWIMYLLERYYDERIYDEFDLVIAGRYESQFFNYVQMIKVKNIFGNYIGDGKRFYFDAKTSQRTPVNQIELFGVKLHIILKSNKRNIDLLKEKIKEKVSVIGRGNDVVFIRKMKEIGESNIIEHDFVKLNHGVYCPTSVIYKEKIRKYYDLPVYYVTYKNLFKENGEIIRSIHKLHSNNERYVEFKKIFYFPFDRSYEFYKKIKIYEEGETKIPLFWVKSGE